MCPTKGRSLEIRSNLTEAHPMYAITSCVAALVLLITPWTGALAQSPDLTVHTRELLPPPHADFHDRMGGWPTELTPRTFHAARGTLVIYAHEDGRTDLVFDFQGLLPYGVYTLWDVVDPNFDTFKDRPLMNVPAGGDPNTPHSWETNEAGPAGGPGG